MFEWSGNLLTIKQKNLDARVGRQRDNTRKTSIYPKLLHRNAKEKGRRKSQNRLQLSQHLPQSRKKRLSVASAANMRRKRMWSEI
jgi:hypothetical protein